MSREFHLQATAERVELWLSRRMPLQPSGETEKARLEVREAIRRLRDPGKHILAAEYVSADDSFFDVENVLLYNIGTSTFRNAAINGVRFIRHRGLPPSSPDGAEFAHVHRYQYVELPERPIGYTFKFEPPRLTTSLKPHDVWWRASEALCDTPGSVNGLFALHVEVTIEQPVTNVAAIIKPFVDGVVCAMHRDSTPNDQAVRRLAAKKQWDPSVITRKLMAPSCPILGERHLLQCYRDFVKWDPADHLCEACTFVFAMSTKNLCTVTVLPHKGSFVVAQQEVPANVGAFGHPAGPLLNLGVRRLIVT